jgi:hypothetical protein
MGSDLGVFGKRKCVLHVNPKIADRVLNLAMAEEYLDGAKVSGLPVDDHRLDPRSEWVPYLLRINPTPHTVR